MPRRFEEWDKDLTLVRAANRELGQAELNLRHQVGVARRHGHSWAAIGLVLDMTRQAARQRLRSTDNVDVAVLFAGVPVTDFSVARGWYERFFARPADIVAHANEVMWQLTDGGCFYITRDDSRAGKSLCALAVSDIEAATSALAARGIRPGPIEWEGDAGRKSIVVDPDGNSIALVEVSG
jgi:predicted enzyme related to lactoylglutathione lyase